MLSKAPSSSDPFVPSRNAFFHYLRKILVRPDLRQALPRLALNALIANILALALPLAILQIFDRVIANQSHQTLILFGVGLFIILLLEELLRGLNQTITNWLAARFQHEGATTVLRRFLAIPLRLFSREESGAYAEKFQTVSKLSDIYSGHALLVLIDLPFILLFLVVIYLIGSWLVLVPLALALAFLGLIGWFGEWIYEQVQARQINEERRTSFLTEVLAGLLSIKTMSAEAIMLRRYERLKEASADQGERLFLGNTLASTLALLMSQFMIVLVIFAGAFLVVDGTITAGALAACMLLSTRVLQPLRKALGSWMQFQSFVAGEKQFEAVMALPEQHPDAESLPPLVAIRRGIELRQVSVRYEAGSGSKNLFEDLSIRISKGSTIAVQGPSGSGKSTFLLLLNGLEYPDSGDVLIDGQPMRSFHPDSVARRIALLPQTGTVYSGSILDNLTLFDPSLEAQALKIAEALGLDHTISGMKQGYQTLLGENATESLPAGVRQLLTIARALVHQPDVILFDEANNALDLETDKRLRQFFEEHKGDFTLVLVSSRPSWLKLASETYRIRSRKLILETEAEHQARFTPGAALVDAPARPTTQPDIQALMGTRVFKPSDLGHCVMPLLTALKWHGSQRQLTQALPHLAEELDLSYFLGTMSNLGYKAAFFGQRFAGFDARFLPCLWMPKGAPAMVIMEALPDGRYRVFDSDTQREECLAALPADQGEIVVFRPEKNPLAFASEKTQTSWTSDLFWSFRWHAAMIFLITLIVTVLGITPSLFVRTVFDTVLPASDIAIEAYLVFGVILALILAGILSVLRNRLLAHIGGRIEYLLGKAVFDRVIRLPSQQTRAVSVSRQIVRIRGLEQLREIFLGPLSLLAFDLPAVMVIWLVIMLINPWAGLLLLGVILLFAVLLFIARPIVDRLSEESGNRFNKRYEFTDEALGAMRLLRFSGARKLWDGRFRDLSAHAVMGAYQERQVRDLIEGAARLIGSLTAIGILFLSAFLVMQGQISSGTVMATMILTWRLVSPIQSLFVTLSSWSRISGTVRQINNLMKMATESERGSIDKTFISGGEIHLQRISFRYAAHLDPALLGLSFSVPPKGFLGITGPDGAGKSTLLSLIARLNVPQAGAIRIDGVDTRQMDVEQLRSAISYMPQQCDLFYGTIAQNLRLAHPAASDEEVRWAIHMAGLEAEVNRLPQGLNTRISNSLADQLSNGFKQRLSLARTMLKPSPIVLLDEPGNGMDDEGEAALVRCMRWLKGQVTLVVVTPRPSHLRMADYILYLEAGNMTARGTYTDIENKIMAGLL
jgi:ATP-binding cassette, subfamily C, bacterial LapB